MTPLEGETDEPDGGPLTGVVVADFSRVLAGPLASMFLADLGATVIKVERPLGGDDTRSWGPPYVGEMSTYFTSVNRNKFSLALELGEPADLEVAHRLVDRCDVVVENFLPGRLARFGLDAPTLAAAHPGLVYCSISGFGSGGGADLPGYDFLAQAVGGLMSITGTPDGPPTKVGVALVDVLTGLHATIGILAALRHRDRTGQGQHVEVNLLSSLLASLANQGAAFINGGGTPGRMGNSHPSVAPYETFATGDGSLAVAVGNDRQFRKLAAAIGRSELADDARFATNQARVTNRPALAHAIEAILQSDTAAVWSEKLKQAGIAAGPVNDLGGAFRLAAQLGLDPTRPFAATAATPAMSVLANPLRMSATPPRYDRPPPPLGADSDQVRQWLASG